MVKYSAACLLLVAMASAQSSYDWPDALMPLLDIQEDYNDTWAYDADNHTEWWETDTNSTTNPLITLVNDIIEFFKPPPVNETRKGFHVFITYVDIIPLIPCEDIGKVVKLFDSRITEANPLTWLKSKAVEYAGKECNATQCSCETAGRRSLASKTLTMHTHSSSNTLRPVRSFPLQFKTVPVIQ